MIYKTVPPHKNMSERRFAWKELYITKLWIYEFMRPEWITDAITDYDLYYIFVYVIDC